jgi:hypothetical protein
MASVSGTTPRICIARFKRAEHMLGGLPSEDLIQCALSQ